MVFFAWATMVHSAGLTQPEEMLFVFLSVCVQKEQALLFPV